jgi:ribosomal-protein-alanine N-acetyltransferase
MGGGEKLVESKRRDTKSAVSERDGKTMTHKGTITLETERLILWRVKIEDADALFFAGAGNPEITRYMTWSALPNVSALREVLEHWVADYKNPDTYKWAIVLKDTGKVIGVIDTSINPDGGVGYWIGKPWWRKGLVSEALSAVLKFMFEEVGVESQQGFHDLRNPASGAVMRKCGMKFERSAPQSWTNGLGERCDADHYAISANDYMITNIENIIRTVLTGETQALALDFVTHLRSLEVEFERGGGYWADKYYYITRYNGEVVCFILINGDETNGEPLGLVIWSDDSTHNSYANAPLDTQTKETAWRHVDICGNCGGCGNPGGSHKTICGKEFDKVCITTFRFDNPNAEETDCTKRLAEIRIKDIKGTTSMTITYNDTLKDLPLDQLHHLFVAVGWSDDEPLPENLKKGFMQAMIPSSRNQKPTRDELTFRVGFGCHG